MDCPLPWRRRAQAVSILLGISGPFGMVARHMVVWPRSVLLRLRIENIPIFSYCLYASSCITTSVLSARLLAFVYDLFHDCCFVCTRFACICVEWRNWTRAHAPTVTRPDSVWMLSSSLHRSSLVFPLRRVFRYSTMSQARELINPARSDPPSSSGASTPLSGEPSKSAGVYLHN
jgi:hypothetical protein